MSPLRPRAFRLPPFPALPTLLPEGVSPLRPKALRLPPLLPLPPLPKRAELLRSPVPGVAEDPSVLRPPRSELPLPFALPLTSPRAKSAPTPPFPRALLFAILFPAASTSHRPRESNSAAVDFASPSLTTLQ
ncbi:hypothetical protein PLICRDRAFT_484267 [Plicaturopsis crispa FD-325 SS-3]|nr:hypothetical protein PLICRDRAFT_484267 [Plicaturopsis crispa FD-325 SS-3]